MARASVEDPLKVFRFRVLIDNVARAGFSEVNGLKKQTEKSEYREGGMNETKQKSAGLTTYPDVTLVRGQILGSTRGGDTDLIDWAKEVHQVAVQGNAANYRREVTIEQYTSVNTRACYWTLTECWVCESVPMSDLKAVSSDNSYETVTLCHEGYDFVQG